MFKAISKTRNGLYRPLTTTRQVSTSDAPLGSAKEALRELKKQPNMVQPLRELRHSPCFKQLLDWKRQQYQAIRYPGNLCNDPHARNAAGAHALDYAVEAVANLSYGYALTLRPRQADDKHDAQTRERAFLNHIRPERASRLRKDFLASWHANSTERQAALLSAMGPSVATKLGLPVTDRQLDMMQAWGPIPASHRLTEAEVLAVVDYVNSETGTFNAVNGAAILAAYYGESTLQECIATFTETLDRAIEKLCQHPFFGRHQIVTYKGINLSNESGTFRYAMLEAALGNGKVIAFPNVLSATAVASESYAVTRYDLGYTVELQIKMPIAAYMDPFHDITSIGQQEIVAPRGQKCIVARKEAIQVFSLRVGREETIDRYVLEPKS